MTSYHCDFCPAVFADKETCEKHEREHPWPINMSIVSTEYSSSSKFPVVVHVMDSESGKMASYKLVEEWE